MLSMSQSTGASAPLVRLYLREFTCNEISSHPLRGQYRCARPNRATEAGMKSADRFVGRQVAALLQQRGSIEWPPNPIDPDHELAFDTIGLVVQDNAKFFCQGLPSGDVPRPRSVFVRWQSPLLLFAETRSVGVWLTWRTP